LKDRKLVPYLKLLSVAVVLPVLLSACLSGGGSGAGTAQTTSTARIGGDDELMDTAPVISGNPPNMAIAGQTYAFVPEASDDDGDSLSFTIQNRPVWTQFNEATGELSGQPQVGDTGSYPGIVIAVSDGSNRTELSAFSISVEQAGPVSVSIAWNPPTTDADGSSLNDLAGYRILFGSQSQSYSNTIDVENGGLTRYVIPNLAPGRYFFAIQAVDSSGNRSQPSNEVTANLG